MTQIGTAITWRLTSGITLLAMLAGCSEPAAPPAERAADSAQEQAEAPSPAAAGGSELPVWEIPNIPSGGEAYYAPDSLHLIAQLEDPLAQQVAGARIPGQLTYIFTDDGKSSRRITDRGHDGCSYFSPDMKYIVWTSTRDNMDLRLGDWLDDIDYPRGADLYISDLEGQDIRRLTNNEWYDAEVSISPDGEWIVFGRQTDGKMDLWRIRPDGTDEQQITFTEDWQEGAPFYLPDSETIMFRAWQTSVKNALREQHAGSGGRWITPMTVFTIKHDGTNLTQRSFDRDMNWAPYPAPDGRHYVFVRVVDGGKNWEVFLGDLAGGEPMRLTYSPYFDGLPSLSPDGKKMVFSRQGSDRSFSVYVMDVSSLNLGPENYQGIPSTEVPEGAVIADIARGG